jgi:hypothetical protein
MTGSESLHRTSNRGGTPITRNKDFFMATVILDSQKYLTFNQRIENTSNQVYKSQSLENLNDNEMYFMHS